MKKTLLALFALTFFAPPAAAGDLAQVVTADEQRAPSGTEATISSGHVDIGMVIGDTAELLARDDTGEPTWRELSDVVFEVSDQATLTLPDDDNYDFVGANAGDSVYVVPQVEKAGVPWLGWNTQSPTLTDDVDMEIVGHQGPGEFSMFLQNGGFDAPLVLYPSDTGAFHVDKGTHTHANWTFTEPGVHMVKIKTTSGDKNAEAVVTFAVGVGADEARGATWDESMAVEGAEAGSGFPWWLLLLGVAGIVFFVGVVIVVARRQ